MAKTKATSSAPIKGIRPEDFLVTLVLGQCSAALRALENHPTLIQARNREGWGPYRALAISCSVGRLRSEEPLRRLHALLRTHGASPFDLEDGTWNALGAVLDGCAHSLVKHSLHEKRLVSQNALPGWIRGARKAMALKMTRAWEFLNDAGAFSLSETPGFPLSGKHFGLRDLAACGLIFKTPWAGKALKLCAQEPWLMEFGVLPKEAKEFFLTSEKIGFLPSGFTLGRERLLQESALISALSKSSAGSCAKKKTSGFSRAI